MYVCVLSCFSCVQFFVTLWTVALQARLSMEFSRQEYWAGLPCPLSGDLPDPGIKPASPTALALQAYSLLLSHQRSPDLLAFKYLFTAYFFIMKFILSFLTYFPCYHFLCVKLHVSALLGSIADFNKVLIQGEFKEIGVASFHSILLSWRQRNWTV